MSNFLTPFPLSFHSVNQFSESILTTRRAVSPCFINPNTPQENDLGQTKYLRFTGCEFLCNKIFSQMSYRYRYRQFSIYVVLNFTWVNECFLFLSYRWLVSVFRVASCLRVNILQSDIREFFFLFWTWHWEWKGYAILFSIMQSLSTCGRRLEAYSDQYER